ncbi:MAG: SBBP repeat-containing protein [Bacteroidetes bacterium]|nr:SBBP repeat-containing protein [Bacteroidota bacterium]
MKKHQILLLVIGLVLICNNLFSQIIPEWATAYTSNYPINIYENDMVTDKTGNVYITGFTTDTTDLVNLITLKYNSLGQLLWMQHYDSVGSFSKIAVDDSGNVYIGGQNYPNLLTIKYNSFGNLHWVKTYTGNLVFDIITDDSSNVYITGYSNDNKFTTIKYNSLGNFKWVAQDGPAMGMSDSYITLDNNRNVYVTARGYDTTAATTCNTIKYNSSGEKQWERIYSGNFLPGLAAPMDMKYDANGFIYVLAVTTNNNDGDGDIAVIKYDTLGNHVWTSTKSFTNYYDVPKAMAIDISGNAYVTGNIYPTGGTVDTIVTMKFNTLGTFKWAKSYSLGFFNNDEASEITIDSLGNIYVVGRSSDASNRENFVTIKYDSLGNEIWVGRYKNSLNSSDYGNSIGLDNNGNVYISGRSYDLNSTAIVTVKYSSNVGIQEFSENSDNILNIYPNPFETNLTIEVQNELKNAELIIYDLFGKEIYKMNCINQQTINIKRNNLADGIYFFRLIENNQIIGKGKIIAQ